MRIGWSDGDPPELLGDRQPLDEDRVDAGAVQPLRQPTALECRGDPARVVAFTDGVFAIVITILVLHIRVPSNVSEQSLRDALDETGGTLVAWIISILLVGMYWVWHRDLFINLRSVNRDVTWLNLLFLLPVSLIPFAAGVLGEYHDEPIALHLHGVVLTAASLARVGLYWYVSRRPALLWRPGTERSRRLRLLVSAAPIGLYLLAMISADQAPSVSLGVYFAVPTAYFVLVTVLRDRPTTSADADSFSSPPAGSRHALRPRAPWRGGATPVLTGRRA